MLSNSTRGRLSGVPLLLLGLVLSSSAAAEDRGDRAQKAEAASEESGADRENDAPSPGPSPAAQRAFQRAEAAFAEGSYGDAAKQFEEADRLAPHASVVFNAAVAWDHAGDSPRAASAYKRALEREGLSQDEADQAEKRLSELGSRLVYVHLAKPLGVTASVAHVQKELIPTRFFLEPGNYEVLLEDGSKRRSEPMEVVRGKQTRFEFDPLKAPAPPTTPPPATPSENQAPSHSQEVVGWVALGVSVASAAVAGYLGVEALSAKERFINSDRRDASARSDASDMRLGANIAWSGAGAFGVTGAILLLTAPSVQF